MATTDLALVPEEERPLSLMLQNPAVMRKFELACGQQAGSVVINIFNAAAANPEIWKCEPTSVINAALDAAALKLSISSSLGQACILPYQKWGKDSHGNWIVVSTRASFVPMKRGIRELAMRTHEYRVLNSFTVYEGQTWTEDQMTGLGHLVGLATSKISIGFGAYLVLFSGYEATEYFSKEEIMEHIIRYSPSWDKKDKKIREKSKWDTDFDMMAEGVVLKSLIRNKGVLSDRDKELLAKNEDSGPDLEKLDELETVEGVTTDAPKESEPISAEEEAYIKASEVQTPSGARLGDMDAERLGVVAKSKAHADTAAAAQIVIDWRKAKEQKALATLGF